jgi:NADPH:quinone reductase-like Zn-dependent oxidoreductase
MGLGLRKPKARVVGRDAAGSVEAVGKEVTEFLPGDEVFGTCRGAFAEYACAAAGSEGSVGGEGVLAPKPANLTFEQAAGVPTSAQTALQGLRDAGAIRDGQSVLIIGASGGVGTFAVQLAKVFEAHVTGVCSTTKVDLVRSGALDRRLRAPAPGGPALTVPSSAAALPDRGRPPRGPLLPKGPHPSQQDDTHHQQDAPR